MIARRDICLQFPHFNIEFSSRMDRRKKEKDDGADGVTADPMFQQLVRTFRECNITDKPIPISNQGCLTRYYEWTKAACAESDDVTRNSYSGFVALRKAPIRMA
jgi:hypothetical protein